MIEVRIQEVAENFGIKNAYQLQKLTGFPPAMASRLWKANWEAVNLKTLNTLCNHFECTPNDILRFEKDAEEIY